MGAVGRGWPRIGSSQPWRFALRDVRAQQSLVFVLCRLPKIIPDTETPLAAPKSIRGNTTWKLLLAAALNFWLNIVVLKKFVSLPIGNG
jgi:hypothetical protein